jgi:hypothetical protein
MGQTPASTAARVSQESRMTGCPFGTAAIAVIAMFLWPAHSAFAVDSFRILQLASSQDGGGQIIELEEVAGKDGQDWFAGLTITVTNRYGVAKTFTFPSDLPVASTANRHVLIGPGGFSGAFDVPFAADFVIPMEFLPTDGGTIDFAGIDTWSFDAIPTDGKLLRRNGTVGQGLVQNFAGKVSSCCGPVWVTQGQGIELTGISVGEYYNASLDHYFISGSQPDIDALISGRIPGWEGSRGPEGNYFPAASLPTRYARWDGSLAVQTRPVCRYFIPPGSHFFSASTDECIAVGQLHPEYVLETSAAFYTVLPDTATGECPSDYAYAGVFVTFAPVYRLWNGRADTNHRYTISANLRAQMIGKGWISEGYGPLGVVMCAPDWE